MVYSSFPRLEKKYVPKDGGWLVLIILCPFGFFIERIFRGVNRVLVEIPLQNPHLESGTLLTNLLPGMAFSFLLIICVRLLFSKKRDSFDWAIFFIYAYWSIINFLFLFISLQPEMAWCAAIVGFICPFFIERSKHKITYHVRLYNYIDSLCHHPKYINIQNFIKNDFKNRKPEKPYHILWEYPFIGLLDIFLCLVTKYHPLGILIISIVFYIALVGGWYLGFFLYFGLVLLLTGLVYFPPLVNHLKYIYGPDCLKKLGWNTGIFVLSQTGKSAGQVVGGTLAGGFAFFKADQYLAIQVRNQEIDHLPIVQAQMIDRWHQNGRHGPIPQFSPEEVARVNDPRNYMVTYAFLGRNQETFSLTHRGEVDKFKRDGWPKN